MIRPTGSEEVCSPIYVADKILTVGIESSNSQAMDSGSDEADQKPKKKPGRKMMMTEPANVCLNSGGVYDSDCMFRNEKHRIGLLNEPSGNERKPTSKGLRVGSPNSRKLRRTRMPKTPH